MNNTLSLHEQTITIRAEETASDRAGVALVNIRAFGRDNEARLVRAIRGSNYFIPELSLVAVAGSAIVGHILFSAIHIQGDDGGEHRALALAPMAVDPGYQRNGIGGRLIDAGLARARALGHGAVIVLGHPEYYPRFGFQPAGLWHVRPPFSVPDDVFMAMELQEHALQGKAGVVEYPGVFDEV